MVRIVHFFVSLKAKPSSSAQSSSVISILSSSSSGEVCFSWSGSACLAATSALGFDEESEPSVATLAAVFV